MVADLYGSQLLRLLEVYLHEAPTGLRVEDIVFAVRLISCNTDRKPIFVVSLVE